MSPSTKHEKQTADKRLSVTSGCPFFSSKRPFIQKKKSTPTPPPVMCSRGHPPWPYWSLLTEAGFRPLPLPLRYIYIYKYYIVACFVRLPADLTPFPFDWYCKIDDWCSVPHPVDLASNVVHVWSMIRDALLFPTLSKKEFASHMLSLNNTAIRLKLWIMSF